MLPHTTVFRTVYHGAYVLNLFYCLICLAKALGVAILLVFCQLLVSSHAVLIPTSGCWSTPDLKGQRPPPSTYFSFIKIDRHRAVLFGGEQEHGIVDDLYLFDFRNMVSGIFAMSITVAHAVCIQKLEQPVETEDRTGHI